MVGGAVFALLAMRPRTYSSEACPPVAPGSMLVGRFQHYEALALKQLKSWLDEATSGVFPSVLRIVFVARLWYCKRRHAPLTSGERTPVRRHAHVIPQPSAGTSLQTPGASVRFPPPPPACCAPRCCASTRSPGEVQICRGLAMYGGLCCWAGAFRGAGCSEHKAGVGWPHGWDGQDWLFSGILLPLRSPPPSLQAVGQLSA